MVALSIRLKDNYTKEHKEAISKINIAREKDELLGVDSEKWLSLLSQIESETGVKFNHKVSENGENILEEEGCIEPIPDPMMMYLEELPTFVNIKATHELGLISDEEMEECNEYMKSIYPSEKSTLSLRKAEKPELFEKFKSPRY